MNTLAAITLTAYTFLPAIVACVCLVLSLLPSLASDRAVSRACRDAELDQAALDFELAMESARLMAATDELVAGAVALVAWLDAGRDVWTRYQAMVDMADTAAAIVAPVAPGAWLDAILTVRTCSVCLA